MVEKYNRESNATQSKTGQIAFIRSNVFKQGIEIMGETIEDMDIDKEQKDNKISFLENKMGITDDKVVEEMKKLDFNKKSNKEKFNRIVYRLNETLNNHKYITKNKNKKTITFK